MAMMENKEYTFMVHPEANKAQIREAIDTGTFAAFRKKMLEQLEGNGD